MTLSSLGTPGHPAHADESVLVANAHGASISLIDDLSGRAAAKTLTLGVGSAPYAIAASPDGRRVYTGNFESQTVTVLDTDSGTALATISLGASPYAIAVSPDGQSVYCANPCGDGTDAFCRSGTVSVIDTRSLSVVDTITVGQRPSSVAVAPDGLLLYVANEFDSTVDIISTGGRFVGGSIALPPTSDLVSLSVSPNGRTLYVVSLNRQSVDIIDVSSQRVTGSVFLGGHPLSIQLSPDGSAAYVSDTEHIWVLGTSTGAVSLVASGKYFGGLAMAPDGAHVFATVTFPGGLIEIDTATNAVSRRFATQISGFAMVVLPDSGTAYISNAVIGDGAVVVAEVDLIDGGVKATFPVGAHPQGIAAARRHELAYVSVPATDAVFVVDVRSKVLLRRIDFSASSWPNAIALAPDERHLYVATGSDLSIIDTADERVRSAVPLPAWPRALAVAPRDGAVYVLHDTEISVIDPVQGAIAGYLRGFATDGRRGASIAVSPNGDTLFVVLDPPMRSPNDHRPRLPGQLVRLDLPDGRIAAVADVESPHGVAVDRDGGYVFVTNSYGLPGHVEVIDSSTLAAVRRISVGSDPTDIALSRDGTRAYVTDPSRDILHVVRLDGESEALVPVGRYPIGVAVLEGSDSAAGADGCAVGRREGTQEVIVFACAGALAVWLRRRSRSSTRAADS